MNLRWKVVVSMALLVAAGSFLFTAVLFRALRDEGKSRRDQNCVITEREQKAEVDQLRNTYRYLRELTPAQRGEPINRAVLRQLPQTEKAARADNAPPYCDEPGIGLPEPDPRIPKRPRELR